MTDAKRPASVVDTFVLRLEALLDQSLREFVAGDAERCVDKVSPKRRMRSRAAERHGQDDLGIEVAIGASKGVAPSMARRLDFSNDNANQGRASTSVGGTARCSPHYRLVFAPSHDPS
jgi:hypothetical protein